MWTNSTTTIHIDIAPNYVFEGLMQKKNQRQNKVTEYEIHHYLLTSRISRQHKTTPCKHRRLLPIVYQ